MNESRHPSQLFGKLSPSVFAFTLMSQANDNSDFVKEETQACCSDWNSTNFTVVESGKHLEALELLQGSLFYGGTREPKDAPLGRSSVATPEQQAINAKKCLSRNKKALTRIVNKNENVWTSFDTFSCADLVRDANVFLSRLKLSFDLIQRKVRERFDPNFLFLRAGIYGFQDGKRREDKQGRFSLHAHCVTNLPYWRVYVITAKIDGVKQYLLADGSWSKVATRDTVFFDAGNTTKEDNQALSLAHQYWQEHIQCAPSWVENPIVDVLPMYSILWGFGHVWREWFDVKKEKEQIQDFGGYMAGSYMGKDEEERSQLTEKERASFSHKKGFFHSQFRTDKDGNEVFPGGLERSGKYYGKEAKQFLIDHHAWDNLVKARSFKLESERNREPNEDDDKPFEIGWMIQYGFNLWAEECGFIETIGLNERDRIELDPEVIDYVNEFDMENRRREDVRKNAETRSLNQTLAPPAVYIQDELFDDWSMSSVRFF